MIGYGIQQNKTFGRITKERPSCPAYDAVLRPLAVGIYNPAVYYEISDFETEDRIVGHEAVGEIVEVGECVRDFKPGDRVVVPGITPNWRTTQVQDIGLAQHSGGLDNGWLLGTREDGVWAEYFRVRDADMNVALLPEKVSLSQAVMVSDMATTGFHGVELADVRFGDSVAVIGLGGVGLMAVAAAKLRGAGRIIGVDCRPVLWEPAKSYGATDLVNFKEGPVVDQIMELTGKKGVDKVVISGGNAQSVADAFQIVKVGGAIGSTNYYAGTNTIPIPNAAWGNGVAHKRLNAGLTVGGRVRMERLLSLVQYERFDPSRMVTHTYRGFEQLETAIHEVKSKPETMVRAALFF